MTLETSKNIGGIGAILMFIGVLPLFAYSGVISLVGLIMVVIGVKGIADYYKESGIFNNALYAVIITIVGAIVAVGVAIIALVTFFTQLGLNLTSIQDWNALSAIDWQTVGLDIVLRFAGSILAVFGVVWVFAIIAAIFVRKSLGLMSTKTGVGMFGTTGLLILIGAIIPLLGLLLIWIGLLLLAVAFFSIRSQPAQPVATAPSPT